MLLLSITNKLLEDVAPVPLLWVLPLALYLLTFALAFSRRSFYSRWWMARSLAVTLGSLGYTIYDPVYSESMQVSVPVFCIGLFVCCLFCHGELARRRVERPAHDGVRVGLKLPKQFGQKFGPGDTAVMGPQHAAHRSCHRRHSIRRA